MAARGGLDTTLEKRNSNTIAPANEVIFCTASNTVSAAQLPSYRHALSALGAKDPCSPNAFASRPGWVDSKWRETTRRNGPHSGIRRRLKGGRRLVQCSRNAKHANAGVTAKCALRMHAHRLAFRNGSFRLSCHASLSSGGTTSPAVSTRSGTASTRVGRALRLSARRTSGE